MRKILPLLVVGILVLGGLGAVAGTDVENENLVSETIIFSEPILKDEGKYISLEFEGSSSDSMEIGKPMLPIISKTYTFPFGTIIDDVEVSFSGLKEMKVPKLIKPAPEALPVSIHAVNEVKNSEEIVSYEGIDIYPEEQFGYRTAAGIKDGVNQIFVYVPLNPIQYVPGENMIQIAEKATINIKYTPPETPVTFPDVYDLLILAPDEFESALQTLVDFKESREIKTKLTTLSEIPSTGVDEQESIKLYIRDAKENWGIDHVLLVGAGVEGQEVFPVRYAWMKDSIEDAFPSDLYFADIFDATGGFPDWDTDNDGKYAEWSENGAPQDFDDVDVLPDVYLGKLPCVDVAEVNHIVNKIIEYKKHNKMTNKIFQVGGDTFTSAHAEIEGEVANEAVMDELPGYSTQQYWASTNTLTKSNIAKGFKSNVDFADFSGHGSPGTWATHPVENEDVWLPTATPLANWDSWAYIDFDIYFINNAKKLPVVFYNACSNNKYSKRPDCLGWKTLTVDGGGIATFAASGIGYGNPGNEVARRFGWIEVHCFQELKDTKVLGEVWGNCITDYYNNFESSLNFYDYKTMIELSMFGDPTTVIEDGEDPNPRPRTFNMPTFDTILERILVQFPTLAKIFEILVAKLII